MDQQAMKLRQAARREDQASGATIAGPQDRQLAQLAVRLNARSAVQRFQALERAPDTQEPLPAPFAWAKRTGPGPAEPSTQKISAGQTGAVVQRVKNEENEPQFFPLRKLTIRDADNYYFYHGTFVSNLEGIGKEGLDPRKGGGANGAARHEGVRSRDAAGLTKFATDPNIAMIYAKAATLVDPPEVGAFLEVRVSKQSVNSTFNDRTGPDEQAPFWRRERGGENSRLTGHGPDTLRHLALNGPEEPGASDTILSVETNQLVTPENIKLVGIWVPPGMDVNENEIEGKLNHEKEALALEFNGSGDAIIKQIVVYRDPWLNR
jgi:hypothetical protein